MTVIFYYYKGSVIQYYYCLTCLFSFTGLL